MNFHEYKMILEYTRQNVRAKINQLFTGIIKSQQMNGACCKTEELFNKKLHMQLVWSHIYMHIVFIIMIIISIYRLNIPSCH